MDIIELLKAECFGAPSKVAFRNLGALGDNVSVKYHDNEGWSPNFYSWSHRDKNITEGEARTLLTSFQTTAPVKDDDLYIFQDGSTMKREQGHVFLPENNGFSVPAQNRWVLRDVNGNALDVRKNRVEIENDWEAKIGKPLTEEERIGKHDPTIIVSFGTSATGRDIPHHGAKPPLPREAFFTIGGWRPQRGLSPSQKPDTKVTDDLELLKPLHNTIFDQMMLNQELAVEPSNKSEHYSKAQMAATSYSNRKITNQSLYGRVDKP